MASRGRLRKALKYIKQEILVEKTVKVQKNAQLLKAIDELVLGSTEYGLTPDEIIDVVKIIFYEHMSDVKRKLLVKSLLPSSYVPLEAIQRCMSWMNTDIPSLKIMSLLLCWIISVFELIEDMQALHFIYPAVFQWLNITELRQHASVLVCLLTRKEDVHLYLVRRLLRLRSILGNDPYLNRVLSLYKDCCPHLVTIPVRYSLKPISSRAYLFWIDHVKIIQARNVDQSVDTLYHNSRAFWEAQLDAGIRPIESTGKKRKITALAPEIKDYNAPLAHVDEIALKKPLVPIHSISSFDQLLNNVLNLELPCQSIFVLKYPVLRNIISCYKDSEYLVRFNYRMYSILSDDLLFGAHRDEKDIELLLLKLIQFCEYLQEGLPVFEIFLKQYLDFIWNGHDFVDMFLSLITRLRLKSIEELEGILQSIERFFHSWPLSMKLNVLNSLNQLLNNMICVEYSRCQEIARIASNSSTMQATINEILSSSLYLFDDETGDFVPVETIVHLILRLDHLYVKSLLMENGHTLILHSALSFYQLVAELTLEHRIPYFQVPPMVVVYCALFSFDGTAVTRLCGLLVKCKAAMTKVKNYGRYRRLHGDIVQKCISQIPLLNTHLLDVLNCLWRDRSFTTSKRDKSFSNTLGSVLEEIDVADKASAFSVLKHPGLIGHALVFDRTVSSLTDNHNYLLKNLSNPQKRAYLQFLTNTSAGFDKIRIFIESMVKNEDYSHPSFAVDV